MTQRDRALAGLEFIRGDLTLKAQRDRAEALCFEFNHTNPADTDKKQAILDELLPNKKGCLIKTPFTCEYGDYFCQLQLQADRRRQDHLWRQRAGGPRLHLCHGGTSH